MVITDIQIPTADQLAPLALEALADTNKQAFVNSHVDGITQMLKESPLSYRNYGAWWWSVKALLKANGVDFGDDDEPVTREHFHYDNSVLLLCAAWAYSNHIMDMGYTYQSIHLFDGEEETLEYSIEDTDMEALAIG